MAKTAIVILNYNGRHYLEKFLPAVVKHSPGCDIIVADNSSTDDSVAYMAYHFPNVKLLRLSYNEGYSKGYNSALKQISTQYYVLLNSDVEVTGGWLSPLIELLDNQPQVAACQPKILSYNHKNQFEYAGAAGGFIDLLGYPFCRGRLFNTLEQDRGQYDDVVPIFWTTGACMAIRSKVFHKMGGFDEKFFAHMEEIDLCWRIHNAGYKVYYYGRSHVYHVGGGTLPKSNPRKTYLNFRNGLSMLYKNSSSAELIWKLPLRIALDLVASLQFFLNGSKEDAAAVIKAIKDFMALFPLNRKKRQEVMGLKNKPTQHGIYQGLIVKDYFLSGKRYFSEINF